MKKILKPYKNVKYLKILQFSVILQKLGSP